MQAWIEHLVDRGQVECVVDVALDSNRGAAEPGTVEASPSICFSSVSTTSAGPIPSHAIGMSNIGRIGIGCRREEAVSPAPAARSTSSDCLLPLDVAEVEPLERTSVDGVQLRYLVPVKVAERDVVVVALGELRRCERDLVHLVVVLSYALESGVHDEDVRVGATVEWKAADVVEQLLGLRLVGDAVDGDTVDRDRLRLAPDRR